MRESGADEQALLEHMVKRAPAAVRLGEEVALAVRVEPKLLRAARLRATPPLDASAEADLWFSPLVESRTPDWVTLKPRAAEQLRWRLARNRERLQDARKLVLSMHRGTPLTLRLEEEILWLALRGGDDAARSIEGQLRRVLNKLTHDPAGNIGLARWFAGAAGRLPAEALKTEAYSLMTFVTSALLDGRPVGEYVPDDPNIVSMLAGILPASVPKTRVWMTLTDHSLTFHPHQSRGFSALELPRTDPLLLDIEVVGHRRTLLTIRRNQSESVAVRRGEIRIRTASGDVYVVRPRPAVVGMASLFESSRMMEMTPPLFGMKERQVIHINENFKIDSIFGEPGVISVVLDMNPSLMSEMLSYREEPTKPSKPPLIRAGVKE